MTTPPKIQWISWKISETSPVGYRNDPTSQVAFKNYLTINNTTQSLDYGTIRFSSGATSPKSSTTQAVSFRKTENDKVYITNMRFWLPSGSAVVADKALIQYQPSGAWTQNLSMPSGSYDPIPQTLPASENIRRQDGHATISGVSDIEHSEFIYTNLIVAPEHQVGTYGSSGSGTLRFRLTYDYILVSDSVL